MTSALNDNAHFPILEKLLMNIHHQICMGRSVCLLSVSTAYEYEKQRKRFQQPHLFWGQILHRYKVSIEDWINHPENMIVKRFFWIRLFVVVYIYMLREDRFVLHFLCLLVYLLGLMRLYYIFRTATCAHHGIFSVLCQTYTYNKSQPQWHEPICYYTKFR